MSTMRRGPARAVADVTEGLIIATVDIAAPLERVFRALASSEICEWWVRPGAFDTREWTGDVRVGGHWRTTGVAWGEPYALEGEYLEVDPPRKLVHTWHRVGTPGAATTVTYLLEPRDGGTRITLRHRGFIVSEACTSVCDGWESAFERLAALLAPERATASR